MEPNRKATIREAARLAGVSVASVSRALNGKPGIGEATRQRILDICEQLNYKPSAAARKLISGTEATVGLLLGEHDLPLTPYVALMHTHLLHELNRRGLVPELIPFHETQTIAQRASAAIVLEITEQDHRLPTLQTEQIPYVCIGQQAHGSWVAPDDFTGVKQITQLLIDQGRRRIGFIAFHGQDVGTQQRIQGYRHAMEAADLPVLIKAIGSPMQPSLEAYRSIVSNQDKLNQVDALVCQSDEIAVGVIQALTDLGYRVPEQIAVTGFDDLPVLANGLTTVRQDLPAIAAQAIRLLDEARQGQTPRGVILPVEVIQRDSA